MHRLDTFDNIDNFVKYFSTEDRCRKYLEKLLWEGEPVCPFCGAFERIHRFKNNRYFFKCNDCRNKFKATNKTILEGTHLSLCTWFLAFYLVSSHSKGISSTQMSTYLNVTQATAWYLLHRIRHALANPKLILSGEIEIDEVYIGGKKRGGKRGVGSENKIVILGMVERGGRVLIIPIEAAQMDVVTPIIQRYVSTDSRIFTDESPIYNRLKEIYKQHDIINHSREFAVGDIYTNTIEGVWSLFKRALFGIYHSVSTRHITKYCTEFAYRYSTREMDEQGKFDYLLQCLFGGRLKYKDLISGPKYTRRVGESKFTASREGWTK